VGNLRRVFQESSLQQRRHCRLLLLPRGGLWRAECILQVVTVIRAINPCRKLGRGLPTDPVGCGALLSH